MYTEAVTVPTVKCRFLAFAFEFVICGNSFPFLFFVFYSRFTQLHTLTDYRLCSAPKSRQAQTVRSMQNRYRQLCVCVSVCVCVCVSVCARVCVSV